MISILRIKYFTQSGQEYRQVGDLRLEKKSTDGRWYFNCVLGAEEKQAIEAVPFPAQPVRDYVTEFVDSRRDEAGSRWSLEDILFYDRIKKLMILDQSGSIPSTTPIDPDLMKRLRIFTDFL